MAFNCYLIKFYHTLTILFSIADLQDDQERDENSIKIISTFSNNINYQLQDISNPYPHQRKNITPDDGSSTEEGEIIDDLSITSEGLTDFEKLTVKDTLNSMWPTSNKHFQEQDEHNQTMEKVFSDDENDRPKHSHGHKRLFQKAFSEALSYHSNRKSNKTGRSILLHTANDIT